jgi:hypothetical protein
VLVSPSHLLTAKAQYLLPALLLTAPTDQHNRRMTPLKYSWPWPNVCMDTQGTSWVNTPELQHAVCELHVGVPLLPRIHIAG